MARSWKFGNNIHRDSFDDDFATHNDTIHPALQNDHDAPTPDDTNALGVTDGRRPMSLRYPWHTRTSYRDAA